MCLVLARQHSTFIENTVKFFKETFADKFPECRHPVPQRSVSQGSSSSSSSRHQLYDDKVILYSTTANNGLAANGLKKKVLMTGNVVLFEKEKLFKRVKSRKNLHMLFFLYLTCLFF